jgi:hypothetical protein
VRELPFSQACENNKAVILGHLQRLFAGVDEVLEIGSGTGQHACHFAAGLAGLRWQPTELAQNLPVLEPRCSAYAGDNLARPVMLDVCQRPWPCPLPAATFTANTLHIMPWSAVEALFDALAQYAPERFLLVIYGPFNYGGSYTSASNAEFDRWLAARDPDSAIRDFEKVDALAGRAGLALAEDNAMPANNRLLAWRR